MKKKIKDPSLILEYFIFSHVQFPVFAKKQSVEILLNKHLNFENTFE
jgi:hypothetical protein